MTIHNNQLLAWLSICLPSLLAAQTMVTPIRVADLNPTGASSPQKLTVGGMNKDMLLFLCNNNVALGGGKRVWLYALNGTTGALTVLSESTGGFVDILASEGDKCFYYHTDHQLNGDGQIHWRQYDSTADGFIPYMDLHASMQPGLTLNGRLIAVGWRRSEVPSKGYEPNAIDPVTRQATLLRDIEPSQGRSDPKEFILHDGKAYFTATNATSGRELYITDGNPNGTSIFKDIIPGAVGSEPQQMRSLGNKLYFSALSPAANREPWICNGTTAGTVKLKEINPSTTVGSDPMEFTAMGNKVFFTADNGTNGRELWITDGTSAGTSLLKDLLAGATGSMPHDLTLFGKNVWFVANDDLMMRSRSLYATDGTAAGTVKMLSLPSGSNGENLHVCNGKLFYVTRSGTTSKMWCTDGTAKGTRQVQPAVSPNVDAIGTERMAVMGNWLYFSGNFDTTGSELWKVQ